jgi:hypothetical protein
MGNIPDKRLEQIVWFENHVTLWAASPATFGVTAPMVLAVDNATKAARTAYTNAVNARQASKNATVALNEQAGTMLDGGRDLVGVIKAFIENSNNPALWSQAGLEPPAPPGPPPVPTAPYQMSGTLDSLGNVIVRWKTSQPPGVFGVIYSVSRSIDTGGGGGEFVLLDSVGEKEYIDEAVPEGTRSVSYVVRSKRGKQFSVPSESLTLRFGRAGGGGFTIVSQTTGKAGGKMSGNLAA